MEKRYKILNMGMYICFLLLVTFPTVLLLFSFNNSNIELLNYMKRIIILAIEFFIVAFSIVNIIFKLMDKKIRVKEIIKNYKDNLVMWIFFIFVMYSTLSYFWSYDKDVAYNGDSYYGVGIIQYIIYFFMVIASLNFSKKDILNILRVFIIASIPLCLVTIIPELKLFNTDINILIKGTLENKNSVFDNSNHYGYYLCFVNAISSIFFLLYKKYDRWIGLAIFIISSVAITYNDTLGIILTLYIVYFLYIILISIYKKKFNIIYIIPILIFFLSSRVDAIKFENNTTQLTQDVTNVVTNNITGYEGTGRMVLWMRGYELFTERPIFGYGHGGADNLLAETTYTYRVHNHYLQLLMDLGVVGCFLYITMFIVLAIECIKRYRKLDEITFICCVGILVYTIQAFFGNPKYNVMCYYFMLVGFVIATYKLNNKKISSK